MLAGLANHKLKKSKKKTVIRDRDGKLYIETLVNGEFIRVPKPNSNRDKKETMKQSEDIDVASFELSVVVLQPVVGVAMMSSLHLAEPHIKSQFSKFQWSTLLYILSSHLFWIYIHVMCNIVLHTYRCNEEKVVLSADTCYTPTESDVGTVLTFSCVLTKPDHRYTISSRPVCSSLQLRPFQTLGKLAPDDDDDDDDEADVPSENKQKQRDNFDLDTFRICSWNILADMYGKHI